MFYSPFQVFPGPPKSLLWLYFWIQNLVNVSIRSPCLSGPPCLDTLLVLSFTTLTVLRRLRMAHDLNLCVPSSSFWVSFFDESIPWVRHDFPPCHIGSPQGQRHPRRPPPVIRCWTASWAWRPTLPDLSIVQVQFAFDRQVLGRWCIGTGCISSRNSNIPGWSLPESIATHGIAKWWYPTVSVTSLFIICCLLARGDFACSFFSFKGKILFFMLKLSQG